MPQTIVVGGGIAGLVTAYRLMQQGVDVRLFEATERPGGLLRSSRRDGVLVEHGPQTLQPTPPVLALIEALGLRSAVVPPDEAAHVRFVLRDGALQALPRGVGDIFAGRLWPRLAGLRMLAEPLVPKGRTGETVYDFMAARFGETFAREVIDPFVAGVFAGDPRQLEMRSAFADVHAMHRLAGSVLWGGLRASRSRSRPDWAPRSMLTFTDGMQTLVDALAAALGDRLVCGHPVEGLTATDGGWRVVGAHGSDATEQVVWAAGLPAASRILGGIDPLPRAPIAAVVLAWPTGDVPAPGQGFGWLAPSHERADVLGCLWVSSVFPTQTPGHVVRRVMIGGSRAPELVAQPDEALVAHARRMVAEVEGIEATPAFADVTVATPGIPQYALGHADRVAALQARWPKLRFVGWDVTGVGASHGIRAGWHAAG